MINDIYDYWSHKLGKNLRIIYILMLVKPAIKSLLYQRNMN